MSFVSLQIKFLLLFLLAVLMAIAPEQALAHRTKRYYHRVAQTLIDAENGISSAGRIYVGEKETEELFAGEQFQGRNYIKAHIGNNKEVLGTFKVTVGVVVPPRNPSSIWKPVAWPGKRVQGAMLWSRPVTVGNRKHYEFLARHMASDVALEMTMMYQSAEKGRRDVVKRFTDFMQNAVANQLYEPEPKINLSGKWSGEMINSRGEKIAGSTLSLAESNDGKISGVWHAGWSIENAKKDGEVVTWEHKDVQDGCRNYKNRMELHEDGIRAVLTYTVADRCREPSSYEGRVNLRKQTSS